LEILSNEPLIKNRKILKYNKGGIIMRWKQFFTPVENMDAEQAKNFMFNRKEGDYTLLDVRQDGEYERPYK